MNAVLPVLLASDVDPVPLVRPTAEQLTAVVELTGAAGDRWTAVTPLPERPGVGLRIRRFGGVYALRRRDGPEERPHTVLVGEERAAAAVLRWVRRWAPPGDRDAVPADPPRGPDPGAELLARAEEAAEAVVHGGFTAFPEAVRELVLALGVPELSVPRAREVVRRVWDRRLEEQEEWEDTDDNDRLDRAFADLDGRGVAARQNFLCCRTCGLAVVDGEGEPGVTRGYAFFHGQDVGMVLRTRLLYIGYGPMDWAEEDTRAIGGEVAEALREAGLPVLWDGAPDTRIAVSPFEWRRRLPE